MAEIYSPKDKNGNNVFLKTHEDSIFDTEGKKIKDKYQTKTDNTLKTNSKDVSGAINELNNRRYSLSLNGNILSILCNGVIQSSVTIQASSGDVYGNIIISSNNFSIDENKTSTLQIKLDAPPTSNQAVNIAVSGDCTVNKTSLIFDNSNYSTYQDVIITANEVNLKGSGTITITSANVESKIVNVTVNNIEEIISTSYNLYVRDNFNETGFYNPDNGNFKTDITYGSCAKIAINGGREIVFNGINGCFFDENNMYISGIPFTPTAHKTTTTPVNAKYFSFGIATSNKEKGYLYYTPISTDSIEKNTNLITNATIKDGGYYNGDIWVDDANFSTTENIKVLPELTVTATDVIGMKAYNKYNIYVGNINILDTTTIPYGVDYVRISFYTSKKSNVSFMLS